jgi:cytochrome c peroxidase
MNQRWHRCTAWTAVIMLSGAVCLTWGGRDPGPGRPLLAREPLSAPPPEAESKPRRPVAIVLADDGRTLLVANRRAGTISTIDLRQQRVVRETAVGKSLSDLQAVADGPFLLAVDDEAHELIALKQQGAEVLVAGRLKVSPYPVTVRVSGDGKQCYLASLWSRRLTAVDLARPAADGSLRMTVRRTLDLTLAPRVQLPVRGDKKLLVADSFGGQLAIIDLERFALEGVRQLPAHNIRGLALSPDGRKVLVAHQILNDLAETTHNDVHWGVLLSNVVRWVVLDRLLTGQEGLLKDSQIQVTGDFQVAGADPTALAVTADGQVVVASAGVDQVAFGREGDYNLARVNVGKRPTALATGRDRRLVYVANTFSDSISVVDLDQFEARREISLGSQRPLTQAEHGELLFYNGRLSLDGWMSCHSCHTDGHSNGLLNDNLGDGSFGAAKRVISLLGVGDTAPWAWNGSVKNLEDQVRKSARTTMQGQEPRDKDVQAIAAYLQTLEPAPPLGKFRSVEPAAVERGREIFRRQECASCHEPATYAGKGAFDVGLPDKLGNRKFNPPSLRGVSQRGPYFHDNRAATLDEVFGKHQHQLTRELSAAELHDLVAFLQSL